MMTGMLRPAAPADRSDLIALVLAEDAAWSNGPEVSAEEAGEVIDHHPPGMVFERDGRVAGYASVGESGGTILFAEPGEARAGAGGARRVAGRARPTRGRQLCGRCAADRVARDERVQTPALLVRPRTRRRPTARAGGLAARHHRGAVHARRG